MQPVLLAFRGLKQSEDEEKLLEQMGIEGESESLIDLLFNVDEFEKSHPNFNHTSATSIKAPLVTWLINIFK